MVKPADLGNRKSDRSGIILRLNQPYLSPSMHGGKENFHEIKKKTLRLYRRTKQVRFSSLKQESSENRPYKFILGTSIRFDLFIK